MAVNDLITRLLTSDNEGIATPQQGLVTERVPKLDGIKSTVIRSSIKACPAVTVSVMYNVTE